MRLCEDLENIIFEYHDAFGMIEKKRRINFVIRQSYLNWMRDAGVYSTFGVSEYEAKQEIYPYIRPDIFISNSTLWKFFLQYFKQVETHRIPCLPSVYSLT